jgi:WD40 repeat protein
MAVGSAPSSVLIVCAPEDMPTVRALARRLHADGLTTVLAADAATPRAQHAALREAAAVLFCLSRRAMPEGQPAPALANLLDLLAVTPGPRRLNLALRLTSCELPAALRDALSLDLFSASGYERLLATLREHAAAVAPPPPAPEPAAPPPPAIPALSLRGAFGLPSLEQQGLLRRLGRGVARSVVLVDAAHALVVSGGGPALVAMAEGTPLWAIDCPTRRACLSPSGRLLALAAGAQIRLWDLADGSLRGIYTGHSAAVSGLAFAPDERTLASSGLDRSVRLWRTGEEGRPPAALATLGDQGDRLTCVAFSPDGTLMAAGGVDRTVRVWRTLDRARVQTLGGHGGAVETLAFSPDGATLAAGSRGREIRLWDTRTWRGAALLEGHAGAIETLAFSPDGATLASGADDHSIRIWRRQDGALLRVISAHSAPLVSLAFSPDGTSLASIAEDNRLLAWQPTSGAQLAALRPLSGRVTSLALSPDGAQLAVGGGDGAVVAYRLDTEQSVRVRRSEHQGAVLDLTFAGPTALVSAAADRTIRACRADAGGSAILLQTHGALHAASLAPGGRLAASSDGEATVQLWRLSEPDEVPGGVFWRVLRGLQGRPRQIGFGPRAEVVAVASDSGAVQLWRLGEREGDGPALSLSFGAERVRSLAFSADGALLAVGGQSGNVRVWRTHDGGAAEALTGAGQAATSLAFAPDGRALAMGDEAGTLLIWRLGAGKRRAPTTLSAHAGTVTRLAYAGALLASGSADGTVRLWRV